MGNHISSSGSRPQMHPTSAQKAAWEPRKKEIHTDVAAAGSGGITEAALEKKLGIKAGSKEAASFDNFFKLAAQGDNKLDSKELSVFEAACNYKA